MLRRFASLFLITTLTAYTTILHAQPTKQSMTKIWENLVVSFTAAKHCPIPLNEEEQKNLLVNLQMMTIRALMEAEEVNPQTEKTTLENQLAARSRTIRAATDKFVAERGCADENVQKMLQMYKMHANWKPLGGK